MSSPLRYSYLSILPDDKADILAASLLILCCSFSSQILSSIAMISFLKRKGLSEARVASVTKEDYGFAVHFFVDS